jgi:DNA processing protein
MVLFDGISRETLVALHETPGVGWKTIQAIWNSRHQISIRPGMRECELRECGLNPRQASAAALRLQEHRIEARRQRYARSGIGVLTIADPEYPERLKQTIDPPHVLYYRGRLELLSRPAIAIVGTRSATAYGKHVAGAFAAAIAERGFAVVSGLAKGIDTSAHAGALDRLGGTIAVLGLPVDVAYPPENRQLYGQIRSKGLLLSEAPPDTPYHSGMFPSRNRIIAGLALGVVIAEAPDDSGALITAENAMAADRPVFVVPGPVTSPRSIGAMRMLADGTGTVALRPEDVIAPFEEHLTTESPPANMHAFEDVSSLTPDEAHIYEQLLDAPRSIDELLATSGVSAGVLNAVLLSLQLKKKIVRMPGSRYGAL